MCYKNQSMQNRHCGAQDFSSEKCGRGGKNLLSNFLSKQKIKFKDKKAFFLLIILLTLGIQDSKAQFWGASYLALEHYGPLKVVPYSTGNDIFDDPIGSYPLTDVYRVSSFTDAHTTPVPGIAWDVHYSGADFSGNLASGLISITAATTAYFSDVCIVRDQVWTSEIHALLAESVETTLNGNEWEIEDFIWDPVNHLFVLSTITNLALGGSHFGTTVNIDADQFGNFAVVFDDNNTGLTWIYTGSVQSGAVVMNYSGAGQVLRNPAFSPDVSLSYDGINTKVYVTSIVNSFSGQLVVDEYNYYDFIVGNWPTPNTTVANYPNYNCFIQPRIACPVNNSGSAKWSVVVQEITSNRSDYYIEGFNAINGGGNTVIDYSNYITATTTEPNSLPVITYDAVGSILVGWNIDNSTSGLTGFPQGKYPVVTPCGNNGVPSSGYLYGVPYGITSTDAYERLAISGRNSTDFYTSYFDPNTYNNPYTKWTAQGSFSGFKIGNSDSLSRSNNLLYIINQLNGELIKNNLILYIYNLNGQLLLKHEGDLLSIKNSIQNDLYTMQNGVYVGKILGSDSQVNISGKLVVNY